MAGVSTSCRPVHGPEVRDAPVRDEDGPQQVAHRRLHHVLLVRDLVVLAVNGRCLELGTRT
jgi:hypothetical protein